MQISYTSTRWQHSDSYFSKCPMQSICGSTGYAAKDRSFKIAVYPDSFTVASTERVHSFRTCLYKAHSPEANFPCNK